MSKNTPRNSPPEEGAERLARELREAQFTLGQKEVQMETLYQAGLSLGAPLQIEESSSPGESHPQALTEPDVNLSAHPALIVQSQVEVQSAISRTGWAPGGPHGPASEPPAVDDDGVV